MSQISLVQGSIVLGEVCDPRGQNKKTRPLLIVTDSADISAATLLAAVAISNSAAAETPRPLHYVELPYHRGAKTGLNKESVALCHWKISIPKASIIRKIGHCHPPAVLEEVLIQAGVITDRRPKREDTTGNG